MTTGLGEHALSRIDENYSKLRRRGTRHHVARVLLVPGRIRHDELAPLRAEKAIGDVNRDTLFALCREPIDKQCEIYGLPLRPPLFAIRFERGELIVVHLTGLIEQAADQRALAIVDAATGDEAKKVGHQKYPSRFLRSIDAGPSWSIKRPWRSLNVDRRISAMISGKVSAALSMAPESG